ncbi:hypothetical protein D9619_009091 [Psilocybe cf. subviscida]|uniref:RlpA-like protein double-psi beta-barrel domain-containing protein n=1 Tax=Psilocybe cf. subviscida TaxID=2480587 RepID=A0A8H5FB09_9AGAR|nr:hypothetical protein D9619_009091 [Psilocybe cf. subviscida]
MRFFQPASFFMALFASAMAATTGVLQRATWYYAGLGACGRWNTNNDHVVALPPLEYAGGTRCGRKVRLHYQGKSVDATVADLCPTCAWNGLDLSIATFQTLANLDDGLIQMNWEYI